MPNCVNTKSFLMRVSIAAVAAESLRNEFFNRCVIIIQAIDFDDSKTTTKASKVTNSNDIKIFFLSLTCNKFKGTYSYVTGTSCAVLMVCLEWIGFLIWLIRNIFIPIDNCN